MFVRVAMGVEDTGGYIADPWGNKALVSGIINKAIEEGLYVIIDWHTHYAEKNPTLAVEFFKEMATKYGAYNNVIYEIYNEPKVATWAQVKNYAEQVIPQIRAIDSDNLIIVGTPFYSQNVDEASANSLTISTNIAYTLHFYAGTHKADVRAKATTAMNNGIALFVTEWGTVSASGTGAVDQAETSAWMQFLKTNNISHANWALDSNAEGSAILKAGSSFYGNWSATDLTTSGTLVRSIIKTW